ncbi:MAG: hypothetical protein QOF33_1978 [Thermomicrobiales bacterium]|jgi:hypothetical protein|nr:hypothetical protein [Thermomicrobiales bacterium]
MTAHLVVDTLAKDNGGSCRKKDVDRDGCQARDDLCVRRPAVARKARKIRAIACVPIVGQLVLFAYALHILRTVATDDEESGLPECRWDTTVLMIGLKCQLLTIVCGLAAGLLTLPLWTLSAGDSGATSTAESMAPSPALVSALHGPTVLLTTTIMALLSALCLTRYAVTGSAWSGLDIAAIWSHLRAEPTIWIAAALIGFTIEQMPSTLAWLLPLPTSWQLPALLIATALFWPFAMLVQAHLIGQAHCWSAQTLARRRRPLIVRVRW